MASQAPFSPNATIYGTAPGHLATIFNGLLPPAGVVDPNFVPQPSFLEAFVDPTTGAPTNNPNLYPVFSGSSFGANIGAPLRYVSPSTQQWNFTLQRALPRKWLMELGYVGSKGTHLADLIDPAQAQLASPQHPIVVKDIFGNSYSITQNTALNVGARSPLLGLDPRGFFFFENAATSRYNSLQATLTHQFAKGFHFQGAYTFSKSIDPVNSVHAGVYNYPFNGQTSLSQSSAISDFDRTHRLVASYQYDIPSYSRARGWQGAALGHWSLAGISVFQSGLPMNLIDSAGGSEVPNNVLPSLAPGYTLHSAVTPGSVQRNLGAYLNRAAFLPAPIVGIDGSTGFGDLPRNAFRGPFQQDWDLSLGKTFPLEGRQELKVSADRFNAWNHPNFDNPSVLDVENPSFGQINHTVGTPRLIQFALRYAF